jgi:hypothetical protein
MLRYPRWTDLYKVFGGASASCICVVGSSRPMSDVVLPHYRTAKLPESFGSAQQGDNGSESEGRSRGSDVGAVS